MVSLVHLRGVDREAAFADDLRVHVLAFLAASINEEARAVDRALLERHGVGFVADDDAVIGGGNVGGCGKAGENGGCGDHGGLAPALLHGGRHFVDDHHHAAGLVEDKLEVAGVHVGWILLEGPPRVSEDGRHLFLNNESRNCHRIPRGAHVSGPLISQNPR